jgi:hypothetical protein
MIRSSYYDDGGHAGECPYLPNVFGVVTWGVPELLGQNRQLPYYSYVRCTFPVCTRSHMLCAHTMDVRVVCTYVSLLYVHTRSVRLPSLFRCLKKTSSSCLYHPYYCRPRMFHSMPASETLPLTRILHVAMPNPAAVRFLIAWCRRQFYNARRIDSIRRYSGQSMRSLHPIMLAVLVASGTPTGCT